MSKEATAEEIDDVSYEERMDRRLSKLKTAVSQDRKKKRFNLLISLGFLAVASLAIYFAFRQATSGGEFMHFLRDVM